MHWGIRTWPVSTSSAARPDIRNNVLPEVQVMWPTSEAHRKKRISQNRNFLPQPHYNSTCP